MAEYNFKYTTYPIPEMKVAANSILRYVMGKIEKGEVHKWTTTYHSGDKEEKGPDHYQIYSGEFPDRSRPCISIEFRDSRVVFNSMLAGQIDIPEEVKEFAEKIGDGSIDIYLP